MLTNRRGIWKELVGLYPVAKTGIVHFLKQKNFLFLLEIRVTFIIHFHDFHLKKGRHSSLSEDLLSGLRLQQDCKMLTKLVQWLILAGVIVSAWMSLLTGDSEWTRKNPNLALFWPVILVAGFGVVSVAIIGKRVWDFNDCHEAADELKKQIVEAKADLTKKGLKLE